MEYPILDVKATGARIKELRKVNHLKVEEIARFMGFESEQAVYKWQRGDSLPTVENLYALSRLFQIPVDDILRGKEDESPLLDCRKVRSLRLGFFYIIGNYDSLSYKNAPQGCTRMRVENSCKRSTHPAQQSEASPS